jgi:HD-GYP domain-containing protein (c-di-GMP phosphodiesterase class II)
MLQEIQPARDSRRGSFEEQAKALAVVLQEEFGTPFVFYDAQTGELVGEPPTPSDSSPVAQLDPAAVLSLATEGRPRVVAAGDGWYQLELPLSDVRRPLLVAVSLIAALARTDADAARERTRLQHWLQTLSDRLRLADQFLQRRRAEKEQSAQSALAWEVLLDLDQLIRRLRIHKEPEKNQQRALEGAFKLLGAQALLWVPRDHEQTVLVQGEIGLAPADCRQLANLLAKCPEYRPLTPLLLDRFPQRSWGARFPEITNLLALPVTDQGLLGWVIALNKKSVPGQPPISFRKSDAALLTPFVALLELHARGSSRYQELKDLLVGLTRSLTTAIDAKDSYTYGHSERVARIAVELGRELNLEGDDLGDIYLAGLLHDVGKIGIRDTVLRKPGPLTPEEQQHIRQHVTIGYSILADLRQIRNLLPGVLYHHERYDGGGYPDGLTGEKIPLLARILAVADAYDAMTTVRPYRDPMPCRAVEEILLKGAGTQWDKRVVDAFMRCRQKIHTIRQRGVGDSLRLAIEGALRSELHTLRTPPWTSEERPGVR